MSWFRLWLSLSALAAGPMIAAADPDPAPAGPVVNLPPMLVEGLNNKGPRWRYASIPGFEILSCAADDATEQFSLKLYRLHAQLRALVPPTLLARNDEPTTLIYYPQSRAESLSQEMTNELKRVQGDREDRPGRVRAPPNLDLRDFDSSVLFSVIEDGEAGHGWRNFGNFLGAIDYGDLVLSPEHVESIIQDRAPSPPPWFAIGFARFYATLQTSDEGMRFSPEPWLGPEEARALKNRPDAFRPTLPLADLLIGRYPREGTDPASRAYHQLWLAESELFIRWCLDGKTGVNGSARDALWRLADAASRQPVTEELFQRCFGMGFSAARDELSDYLSIAVGRSLDVHLNHLGADPAVHLADASSEVIHRIKGEWARRTLQMVRNQYPTLLPIYIQQARGTLQKAYDQHERDPRLVADLGLLYGGIGEPTLARHYLEESFQSASIRASALAALARLRLDDAKLHPGASNGNLSATQVESVLVPVRAARHLSPPQLAIYSVVADLSRRVSGRPSPEVRSMLTEGAELFPSVGPLVLVAAVEEGNAGSVSHAIQLTEMGMWTTTDAATFQRLKSVRNALLPKPTK